MDYTTRLLLQKPNPDPVTGDFLDVSVLNANADRLDAVASFTVATSTARPGTPFQGQGILETDTGKGYVWGGSAYKQLLLAGAAFDGNIGLGTAPDASVARRIKTFWAGTMGGTSHVLLEQSGAAAGSRALGIKAGGEANERYTLDFDGKMQWGPGTAGGDITIGRSAAGVLDISTGTLTVGGTHPAVAGSFAKYATAGTYTWTKPAKAQWVRVRIVGGGGAGGGSTAPASGAHAQGGGGGGACYAEKWFAAIDLTATVSITVAAGATGTSGAGGTSGGTSYFGPTATPFLSASGGAGGIASGAGTATWGVNGGVGGGTAAGAPDLLIVGTPGHMGYGSAGLATGGAGGSSALGGGGGGTQTVSAGSEVAGQNATGYGGGGGGSASAGTGTAMKGGDGADGIVIVETYY